MPHFWQKFNVSSDDGYDVHVVPVTEEGEIIAPHALSGSCPCEPRSLLPSISDPTQNHIFAHKQGPLS